MKMTAYITITIDKGRKKLTVETKWKKSLPGHLASLEQAMAVEYNQVKRITTKARLGVRSFGYLKGVTIASIRSTLTAVRFIMEAVPQKISIQDQNNINCGDKGHFVLLSCTMNQNGIASRATKISATLKLTIK